jgi:hypothetical protein
MGRPEPILKGTDQPVDIELVDDVTGDPINPNTDLTGALVFIYYESGGILDKFSLNSRPDYGPIVVTNASEGKIKVKLQSDVTKDARTEWVYAEIKIQEDNTAYQNDTFETAERGLLIGEIVESHSTHKHP